MEVLVYPERNFYRYLGRNFFLLYSSCIFSYLLGYFLKVLVRYRLKIHRAENGWRNYWRDIERNFVREAGKNIMKSPEKKKNSGGTTSENSCKTPEEIFGRNSRNNYCKNFGKSREEHWKNSKKIIQKKTRVKLYEKFFDNVWEISCGKIL